MYMPNAYDMLRWIHFLCAALAGGGMVMCLLVSGFEDTRDDLRGLAATLWSRIVSWSLRLAVLVGIGLVVWTIRAGGSPFVQNWLWIKIGLVVVLFGLAESAPKALAAGKRGAALLALLLFLLATFATFNKVVFGFRRPAGSPAVLQPAR